MVTPLLPQPHGSLFPVGIGCAEGRVQWELKPARRVLPSGIFGLGGSVFSSQLSRPSALGVVAVSDTEKKSILFSLPTPPARDCPSSTCFLWLTQNRFVR